jgi:Fe-S cluster assembly protein SufD
MSIEVMHEVNPTIGVERISAKIDRTNYLSNLVKLRNEDCPDWMKTARDQASAIVQEMAIPSARDEDWRFTDLSELVQTEFETVQQKAAIGFELIKAYMLPETTNSRLVFVDGVYAADLSSIDDLPESVFLGSLAQSHEFLPQVSEYFGKLHWCGFPRISWWNSQFIS